MLFFAKKLTSFFLILQVAGIHWALLQSIAWSGMLAENIRQASLKEAVSRTFDGEHPCGLCTAIDEGKKSEKKQEFQLPSFKQEFVDLDVSVIFSPPLHFWENDELSYFLISSRESPPTPPPQAV